MTAPTTQTQSADESSPRSELDPSLSYLMSEAARTRYVLAAHYLRDCADVVEIGGFETPITDFLTAAPRSVRVLDPKTRPHKTGRLLGRPCDVQHIDKPFQRVELNLGSAPYGLVIIGCSIKIKGTDQQVRDGWRRLYQLVDGATVTVLEYALGWSRAERNVAAILANTSVRTDLRIDMDMSGNPGMGDGFEQRRFMVLRSAVKARDGTRETNMRICETGE